MIAGTDTSAALVSPGRAVSNVRAERQGGHERPVEAREPKTPAEGLARSRRDPVEQRERADEALERREREPVQPPEVRFRELGSDDEGGPLVDVEGIPEAVRAHPLVEEPEIPRESNLKLYDGDARVQRPQPTGETVDRLL